VSLSIELSREAEGDLERLFRSDRRLFDRVLARIESLSQDPAAGKPLVGNHAGEFSLRVGRYRIVYETDRRRRRVFILTVKPRKHVY